MLVLVFILIFQLTTAELWLAEPSQLNQMMDWLSNHAITKTWNFQNDTVWCVLDYLTEYTWLSIKLLIKFFYE